MADLDCDYGYGDWGNAAKVVHMRQRTPEEQKEYAKQLWQEDPKKYEEWKHFCMELEVFPNFFGTLDNPIPIDESKL